LRAKHTAFPNQLNLLTFFPDKTTRLCHRVACFQFPYGFSLLFPSLFCPCYQIPSPFFEEEPVEMRGFEPLASALQRRRSPS
jgi:hypothetical protein